MKEIVEETIVITCIVRKAELKDVETLADFNRKLAAETEGKNLDRETVVKGVTAVIKDPHKGFYIVAETRTEVVQLIGQLMITFEWSDWRNQCFWWIQSVYVPEKFRNQRIFSELYRYIVKMANRRGNVTGLRLYVEKHNVSAKRVYKTLGMKKASYEIYEQERLYRIAKAS